MISSKPKQTSKNHLVYMKSIPNEDIYKNLELKGENQSKNYDLTHDQPVVSAWSSIIN